MEAGNSWIVKEGSSGSKDKKIIDHIMLRYRPIAPKPVADSSAPASNNSELVTYPRKKRKYVRVKKTRRCKIDKDESKDKVQKESRDLHRSNSNGLIEGGSSINLDFTVKKMPFWMNRIVDQVDRPAVVEAVTVVETWMMVDGFSDETWLDKRGLGSTDIEKMKNLEIDSCPGLISDEFYKVQWVNSAYKNMVVDPLKDGGGAPPDVVVGLVVKEKIPWLWKAFACTVRVVYTWRKEKYTQTMPCDVWKMDLGGFAWRLDAKAALSLGR